MTKEYDVAVIGGGLRGIYLAREARKNGLSVVLFEKERLGGASIWGDAPCFEGALRGLGGLGLGFGLGRRGPRGLTGLEEGQWRGLRNLVQEGLESTYVNYSVEALRQEGITVIFGKATSRGTKRGRHLVGCGDLEYWAQEIFYAVGRVGSLPRALRPFWKRGVFSAEGILALPRPPRSVVIVTADYGVNDGLQLGITFFLNLGCAVTLIQKGDRLLGAHTPLEIEETVVGDFVGAGLKRYNMAVVTRCEGRHTSDALGLQVFFSDPSGAEMGSCYGDAVYWADRWLVGGGQALGGGGPGRGAAAAGPLDEPSGAMKTANYLFEGQVGIEYAYFGKNLTAVVKKHKGYHLLTFDLEGGRGEAIFDTRLCPLGVWAYGAGAEGLVGALAVFARHRIPLKAVNLVDLNVNVAGVCGAQKVLLNMARTLGG